MVGRMGLYLSAAIGLIAGAASAQAEDPAAIIERLKLADVKSSLVTDDMKTWHYKMSLKLFDETGKPTDEGTIEEWFGGPMLRRVEYRTGQYTATTIDNGDKTYRTRSASWPPYYLVMLVNQVTRPIGLWNEAFLKRPELRTLNFGKAPLDCIMMSQPFTLFKTLPLGLFPTYCFDPGKDIVRAILEVGGTSLLRSDFALFQGKPMPRHVTVEQGGVQVASGQIIDIQEEAVDASRFVPSDDVGETNKQLPELHEVATPGKLLSQFVPRYPEAAALRNASGPVGLAIQIGLDGRVHRLTLISAPDPDLALAAIAAVRRWVYEPYLVDGKPIEIYTRVYVNFENPHSQYYAH